MATKTKTVKTPAQKAWNTRRARAQVRINAANKAWATRRANAAQK